eukprot:1157334-Pelagomonas_calceolata.AAC.15
MGVTQCSALEAELGLPSGIHKCGLLRDGIHKHTGCCMVTYISLQIRHDSIYKQAGWRCPSCAKHALCSSIQLDSSLA